MITKKIRFEVFKRDGFKCQYCGLPSPQVVLEIDHVIPSSQGGSDGEENLITACFECNRGKGKDLLENYREGSDPNEQAILLLERERQLREYNVVLKQVRDRKEKDLKELMSYFADKLSIYDAPIGILRRALDKLPREQIKEAIDICATSHRKRDDKSWKDSIFSYFAGIIRNMIEG